MATLADYFAGVTGKQKFSQIVSLEMLPNMMNITDENGVTKTYITSYTRNLFVGDFESRTYVFEGVPVSIAESLPSSVTVTEVDGSQHTVYLNPYVTDGSSGINIFEKDNNAVNIIRTTPHMRTIEVTRRVGALKQNGTVIISAPSW